MTELIIDTDVFIDHLRGARPLVLIENAAYSSITRAELFAGPEREEMLVEAILGPYAEISVDRQIARRAGRLSRTMHLAIPDALIAATALEQGVPLITRNVRDFGRVADLQLRDPATL